MTIEEFAGAAAQFCLMTGGSQTSGGRSTKHNKDVGGVPHSPHRFFRACDVVYDDPGAATTDERIVIAQRLGLLLYHEGDHDHLQPLNWPAG